MKQRKYAPLSAAAAALILGGLARAQAEAPPVCNSGGPYVAECTGQITAVGVDGTASFDPDGTPVTFFWFEECPFGFFDDPTSGQPNFVIDNTGVCIRTCIYALRVTSGGATVACQSSVTVQDTTAPVITCPGDITEIWTVGPAGGQTDPSLTGFATAVDCDPNPVIAFSDTLDPGTAPGEPETIVTRIWTATDFCGNQSSCTQTITLLSPSQPLGANLDVMPGSCPNQAAVNGDGVLTVVLFGTSTFDVSQVDRTTLALQRHDNLGFPIRRMNIKIADKGKPASSNASCACGSASKDGRLDMQISVNYNELLQAFEVLNEAPSTQLTLSLTGKLNDGRWFVVSDCLLTP
jgi:hypothetical protein